MRLMKKKGLSPVIATLLLVGLALTLAIIIFLWARSFVGERLQKDNQNIENRCEDVSFVAEILDDGVGGKIIWVTNDGNVPLYGVEIKKKKTLGEITSLQTIEQSVLKGETKDISVPSEIVGELESGSQIIVSPVLLGALSSGQMRSFVCDSKYGEEITVS